ncbi:MAG TPA: hypothetical protein VMS17_03635 [Gemmataceae bacterium]|nr:hypothetical protein [Gemmataceae bacterium]
MTTATQTAPTPFVPPATPEGPHQLTIISHSNLYYWWPVWAFGFVMAVITWAEGYVMVVVPRTAVAYVDAIGEIDTSAKNEKGEDVTTPHVLTERSLIIQAPQADDVTHSGLPIKDNGHADNPFIRVSPHRALGVIFVMVLLLVVVGTNVPFRGMWSVMIIVVVVATTIVFTVLGWMETLLTWFWMLDVRINMAGYFTISTFLFVIWLLGMRLFDKQRYITFTPGQVKVCEHIGGGEKVYSTDGMTLQKKPSDFLRHYLLGLGAGDLLVHATGAQGHQIDLPNVLFINYKLRQIETLLKTKNVVAVR